MSSAETAGATMEELGHERPAPPGPAVDFETFVAVAGDRLLRTAYLLTRDAGLAEDLLQTALAKAWGRWPGVRGSHEAYVRKILVNTYASWWQRRWRGEQPDGDLPDGADLTDRGPEAAAERIDLLAALGRLPRRQQATVVLRFYEGLSEAQTAELLGCSVGTVKSQTSKALARLRIDPALSQEAS